MVVLKVLVPVIGQVEQWNSRAVITLISCPQVHRRDIGVFSFMVWGVWGWHP